MFECFEKANIEMKNRFKASGGLTEFIKVALKVTLVMIPAILITLLGTYLIVIATAAGHLFLSLVIFILTVAMFVGSIIYFIEVVDNCKVLK